MIRQMKLGVLGVALLVGSFGFAFGARPIQVNIENDSTYDLSFKFGIMPRDVEDACNKEIEVRAGEKKVLYSGTVDWESGVMEDLCSEVIRLEKPSHSIPTKNNYLLIFNEGIQIHRFMDGAKKVELAYSVTTEFGPGEKPENAKIYNILVSSEGFSVVADFLFGDAL